jgi:hypothetical protein
MEESECAPPPSVTRVGVPRSSWVRVWHVGPTGGKRGEGASVYAVARPVPARMPVCPTPMKPRRGLRT